MPIWLLNAQLVVDEDWDHCLTEFVIDLDIPPYATLSHTWTPGQEVLFHDLYKPTNRCFSKTGWAKLLGTARFALRQEPSLDWIWIDTCCINKESTNELSLAINSMFKWYHDAVTCVVLLEDVADEPRFAGHLPRRDILVAMLQVLEEVDYHPRTISDEVPTAICSEDDNTIASPPQTVSALISRQEFRDWCLQLSQSRWFTRGWTLQELIASTDVKFVTKTWEIIASKSTKFFARILERITTIPYCLLMGVYGPSDYNVAERMYWAAQRNTTRPEDIAYCMLGIFGVSIDLRYGEGQQSAFLRLQEQILRKGGDNSIFLWTDPRGQNGSYRDLLARSPRDFLSSSTYTANRFAGRRYERAMNMMAILGGLELTATLISLCHFDEYHLNSRRPPEMDDLLRYIDSDESMYLLLLANEDDEGTVSDERIAAIFVKRLSLGESHFARVYSAWTVQLDNSKIQYANPYQVKRERIRLLECAQFLQKHKNESNLQIAYVRFETSRFRYSESGTLLVLDRSGSSRGGSVGQECRQISPRCSQIKIAVDIESLDKTSDVGKCRYQDSIHTYCLTFLAASDGYARTPTIIERTLVEPKVGMKRKHSSGDPVPSSECPDCRITLDGDYRLTLDNHQVVLHVARLYIEHSSTRTERQADEEPAPIVSSESSDIGDSGDGATSISSTVDLSTEAQTRPHDIHAVDSATGGASWS